MKNLKLKNSIFKQKGPVSRKAGGFTIIELVISIFVLSIAVVGIYNAFSVIMILTADSADRLTATYLAQEGMEIVRNIRDTNWLKMDAASTMSTAYSWDNGLAENGLPNGLTCNDLKPCEADYTSQSLVNGAPYLQLNPNGFYVYGDNSLPQTKFKRRIIITQIPDVDGIVLPYHILKVKVEVSWSKKATTLDAGNLDATCGKYNCVTTQETLYNWYNTNILVAGVKIVDLINSNPTEPKDGVTTLYISSNNGPQNDLLTFVTNPLNATNQGVTWSSSNEACVIVSVTGLVSVVGPSGCDATVEVTTADGSWTYKDYFHVSP